MHDIPGFSDLAVFETEYIHDRHATVATLVA
jgi:hypothetical protein